MECRVEFSDGRVITWKGLDHETVLSLATELAGNDTFVVTSKD